MCYEHFRFMPKISSIVLYERTKIIILHDDMYLRR